MAGNEEMSSSQDSKGGEEPSPDQSASRSRLIQVHRSSSPLRLEPPPQIRKPKRHLFQDIKSGGTPNFLSSSRWKSHNVCARSQYCPVPPPATPVHTLRVLPEVGPENAPHFHSRAWRRRVAKEWDGHPYIVVGIMGEAHSVLP